MEITLFGPWELHVSSIDAAFAQAVQVRGSNHDGIFVVTAGDTLSFDAPRWTLEPVWSADAGLDWHPSRTRRRDEFVRELGHLVWINCDDGPTATSDGDFDDVVLRLRAFDPDSEEAAGWGPFDFTFGPDGLVPNPHGELIA